MDRRELLGVIGALGATSATAADHGGKEGGPMSAPHFHFCGIHMAKKNKNIQFVTQHYCAAHSGGARRTRWGIWICW